MYGSNCANKGGACGIACHDKGVGGGAMRSLANTHKAQWSSMDAPGTEPSPLCALPCWLSAVCGVPSVVHTAIHGTALP
jgi:hypothetical protein